VVGDSGKIFRTYNGGASWSYDTSLTTQKIFSVYFPLDTIGYASGQNGLIRKLVIDTNTSNPNVNELTSNPFSLQVFPNPSAATATVSYELKNECEVEIKISDVPGREFILLPRQKQKPGTHSLTITFSQYDFAKGNYILKVHAGEKFSSVKLAYH
jgi:hypothetical protein